MLMASMHIEVAASSSPFNHSRRDHKRSVDIKDYINSQYIRKNKAGDEDEDSSWLPPMNANNDDSWLPATSQNSTLTSESEASNCRKGQNNVDDSWLPTINDTGGKNGTNTNELDNDIDLSWLPSTFIDNTKNKQKKTMDNDKNKQKNINEKNKNKNPNPNPNPNPNTNTNKNKNILNNIKNSSSSSNNINNSINNRNSNSTSKSNNSPQKKSRNHHWALARQFVFSCDPQHQKTDVKTSNSPRIKKQDSPSKSRYVVESPTSGGVSSLLQRWKSLAEVKNSDKNDNISPSSIRNSLGSSCKEDNNSNSSNSPSTPSTIDDSNPEWESDKATRRLSCPLPRRDSKDSNPGGAEKEKIRVVDIIKKLSREEELAASGNGNESLPPIRTTLCHQQIEGEHKGFKSVKVSRHLIRGRQAFNNFLMQMEHDKNHELRWLMERRVVSKFSHRGRIQAMLRFKILRLGSKLAEPKPEVRRHSRSFSKTWESNNRLGTTDLREKFNSGVEKGATASRKYKISVIKKTPNEETAPTTSTATKEVEVMAQTKTATTNKKQEPQSKPEPMNISRSTQYSLSSRKDVVHKAKFVDSSSTSIMRKEDTHNRDDKKYDFYEDEGQFESARTSYSQMEDRGVINLEETDDTNKKQTLEGFEDWMTSDYSQTRSELDEYRYLDEDDSYDIQVLDSNYDWISDISRPKSDWEYLRQARYQEMSSGKGDIQRLLERKSVSSFLGSGLRDLLDQLMVSRTQQSSVHVEEQELVVREKGESKKEEVGQEDCSTIDEDGDCRSRSETKCSEYSEYVDQTPYSEPSWRPNDNVYNSETATTTSPSLERSPLSNRSQINSTPQSTSTNTHRTIEMELIYDLRGHMEQLHHEILDLRKSIKSCVNMQVKLQHSFKQHVANTPTLPDQKKERKQPGMVKLDCSICCDMQVDSLLYRCGHMCTCFKCALELQQTSGECPVCEAPIVDVVKAFAHEN